MQCGSNVPHSSEPDDTGQSKSCCEIHESGSSEFPQGKSGRKASGGDGGGGDGFSPRGHFD